MKSYSRVLQREGGVIAQGILSIFRGFCDAQINILYILNSS